MADHDAPMLKVLVKDFTRTYFSPRVFNKVNMIIQGVPTLRWMRLNFIKER